MIIQFDFNARINEEAEWINIEDLNENQRRTKLAFKIRVSNPIKNDSARNIGIDNGTQKEFLIVTPYSPFTAKRVNLLAGNPIVQSFLENNDAFDTLEMLYDIHQIFRNNNSQELVFYNQ